MPLPIAAARIVLTLALTTAGASGASAWGWWDRCEGYHCYGPPYGNYEPPPIYMYDLRTGPTWTGNGWANLPIGVYTPGPPVYAPEPPPVYRYEYIRERWRHRRFRP